MAENTQKKIFLWTLPRSLSTAVIRGMSTVRGCKAINEPYLPPFFAETKPFIPMMQTQYGLMYEQVRTNVERQFTGYDFVFVKEMPGHMGQHLGDDSYIPEESIHTFLIRHPVKTTNSFVKLGTDNINEMFPDDTISDEKEVFLKEFLSVEGIRPKQSLASMMTIYRTVTETYKQKPVVIDADDLQRNPEGTLKAYCKKVGIPYQDSMVHWRKITPEQREIFAFLLASPWGTRAMGGAVSGAVLEQSEPCEVKPEDIDEKYRILVEENLPFYQQLYELRIKPA